MTCKDCGIIVACKKCSLELDELDQNLDDNN